MTPRIRRTWWIGDPDVVPCPSCGCPLQRTPNGTLDDAKALHFATVHNGRRPASLEAGAP